MSVLNLTEIDSKSQSGINPFSVHEILTRNMLVDGFDIVLDLKNSYGCYLVDEKTGNSYLDFFTFFASSGLGMNHPKMNNTEFRNKIATAALNKPSNSDMFTTYMAEFVNNFATIAKPEHFKYLFFVEGGSVAVENGLKVAFDWKVQKNFEKGYKQEKGQQVIHFKEAFHGRTGYTLSLTNTDPNKVNYFPKFNWPRITNPKIKFPLEENFNEVIQLEQKAIDEIYSAIKANKDDIACLIIEPIQAEGGDHHIRKEFFIKLREICDENEILLMFDEVQTGLGITGKMWASEYFVMPDIIAFGKKVQVCGIMVSDRIDDIKENVFHKKSRINSTWGGNFTDMVRSAKILEIMYEGRVVENAKNMGAYLQQNLFDIQAEFPNRINNVRGLGLMRAMDFPTPDLRSEFIKKCFENNLMFLGCGEKTVRFRTPLIITKDEIDEGLKIIKNVLALMSK